MKTVTDHLRDHLFSTLGGFDRVASVKPPLESLYESEWGETGAMFTNLMRNRKVMSAIRYGLEKDRVANRAYDVTGAIRRHLDAYEIDHNTEHLVDMCVYAVTECLYYPDNFHATDEHPYRCEARKD